MNKLFVAVFVVAIGASYGFLIDTLPFLCREDKDCGAHKCCAFGRVCFPKLGANFLCGGRLASLHKCGCDDGLDCKVTQVINVTVRGVNKVVKIRQCRRVDEVVVPEGVEYDAEESRQKRGFLPDITGITGAISGAIGGAVDTLFRKCSDASDCGDKRCCASYRFVGKRCIIPFPLGFPCPRNGHCCGKGLECRSLFTVTTGEEGGPTKKPVDLKFCRRISDPVTPPTEVEIDEE